MEGVQEGEVKEKQRMGAGLDRGRSGVSGSLSLLQHSPSFPLHHLQRSVVIFIFFFRSKSKDQFENLLTELNTANHYSVQ